MLHRLRHRSVGLPCAILCTAICRFRLPSLRSFVTPPGRASVGGSRRQGPRLRAHTVANAAAQEVAHIFAIATEYRQEAVILQRCAERLGYNFQFAGLREPWIGWGTKLIQYRRALRKGLHKGRIAPTDPVLFIDGWDCALVGPADELKEKMRCSPFADSAVPWYAGERIIGPDFFKANRVDAVYGDLGTPWKYPNAGAMCGRAEAVLHLFENLLDGFPEDGNDQGRLHEYLLELGERGDPLPYYVDATCRIFQCLYEAEPQWDVVDADTSLPRLQNRLTGERPVVLHGNGHTGRWFMTGLWRDMRFLQRAGLSVEDLAHLPHDGPVPPGTWPDEATKRNWDSTFQLYRIYEKQQELAREGIAWDPWKMAEEAGAQA